MKRPTPPPHPPPPLLVQHETKPAGERLLRGKRGEHVYGERGARSRGGRGKGSRRRVLWDGGRGIQARDAVALPMLTSPKCGYVDERSY